MKTFRLFLFTLFVGAGLIACGGDTAQDQSGETPAQTESAGEHSHDGHDHSGHDHDGHDHSQGEKAGGEVHTGFSVGHGDGKEYTSSYICPMHCKDSGNEQPGKCPVCGMDYVALKEHVKDGHNHN